MHLWHPLTLIKGNDDQGEEEKGVISERNWLIIDLCQCMFPHCSLILVNQVMINVLFFYLLTMTLNCMRFFFHCVTACFSLQMCDNHAKCVILGRSKVCIFGHSNCIP